MKDHPDKPVAAAKAPRAKRKGNYKAGPGRPSIYTEQIAETIIKRMSDGTSLRKVLLADDDLPEMTTVIRWLADPRFRPFRLQYALACEMRADKYFDESLDLADKPLVGKKIKRKIGKDGKALKEVETGDNVERSRLQIDTRKWAAGKLSPKKYGEKMTLEGNKENPLQVNVKSQRFTLSATGGKKIVEG